jgi:CIC family chloride channel protein
VHAPSIGISGRVAFISCIAVGVAVVAGFIAQGLTRLVGFVTNLAFYGRVSFDPVSPAGHRLGLAVILVPMVGGLIVGLMARFGSKAIRGHGIPEAMEQVLHNESRIPARMTFLKPLSAAIAIGTGGPFGAEGPIIATGGALGSLVGQIMSITVDERKTLLGAGAAAGMAATFGSPVSAVILAIELLVFEYRPRSLVPIALAAATATSVRLAFTGPGPAFALPALASPSAASLAGYVVLGAAIGLCSVAVTRAIYAIEDGFAKLPIHWMWWPVLGAIPVGVIGYFAPRTMGVGYDNIEQIVGGALGLREVAFLCGLKFLSWAFALGSGTSGGTLAPLLTIGGGLGALLGALAAAVLPSVGVDPRMAAVVGMAALFAGASRAMLASVMFAFEATHEGGALLPLLGGCAASFLVSCLLMKNSIMTEKMARKGVPVPSEYAADFLEQLLAKRVASSPVFTIAGDRTVADVREWLASGAPGSRHQGFPIVGEEGELIGVLTHRDLLDTRHAPHRRMSEIIHRGAVFVYEDATLRQVADRMTEERIGRVPVVTRTPPLRPIGMVSRSDLLHAHQKRLTNATRAEKTFSER